MNPNELDHLYRVAEAIGEGRAVDWEAEARERPQLASYLDELQMLETMGAATAAVSPGTDHVAEVSTMGKLEERVRTALAERYRIQRVLGRGAMAVVFLAEDPRHGRVVAIKVFDPRKASSVEPERFLREIAIVARLQHPHIVPLFDSGSEKGLLWFAMPYVEGETLRVLLARHRQLPLDDAVRFATELAEALDVAHRAGVVHRDLKPENVLLSSGHALLADFGIARLFRESQTATLTSPGTSLGTPSYMSPEQVLADPATIGPPSDQYALACLLYEMLVGEPPFAGRTSDVVQHHLTTKPPRASALRPGLHPALDAVIAKGMAKSPADRYASAGELAAAARAAAAGR